MSKEQELMAKWLGANYQVTQRPGPAAPSTRKYYKTHQGYDFATPVGTKVKSGVSGEVIFSGWDNQGWGNRVGVYDPATNRTTYLSHLSKTIVPVGAKIKAGDYLGYTGNTGNSTGPHLDITEYLGRNGTTVATQPVAQAMQNASAFKQALLKDIYSKARQKYGKSLLAVARNPQALNKFKGKGKVVRITV